MRYTSDSGAELYLAMYGVGRLVTDVVMYFAFDDGSPLRVSDDSLTIERGHRTCTVNGERFELADDSQQTIDEAMNEIANSTMPEEMKGYALARLSRMQADRGAEAFTEAVNQMVKMIEKAETAGEHLPDDVYHKMQSLMCVVE